MIKRFLVKNKMSDDQIFYQMYGTQSEEHKDYFKIVRSISEWIAARIKSETAKDSDPAIKVRHSKEKWGTVRVYCHIDKERYVEALRVYRHVYLEAKQLWPRYWHAICSGASYSEYLFETKQDFISSRSYVPAYRADAIRGIYKVCDW